MDSIPGSQSVNPTLVRTTKASSIGTKNRLVVYLRKNGMLWLLAAPGLILIFLFQYVPMGGIVIAFEDFRNITGIFGSKWIGFENFKFIFGSGIAWKITFNTVYMNFLFIITGTLCALILAILLNEIYHSKLTQIYQVTLFLPFFVGFVFIGYIAYALLGENGYINTILKETGLAPVAFYSQPGYWRYILVIANLWTGVGFGTIIYLSGIIAIDPELYEAAQIDGANKWQQIIHITIPLIAFLIVIQFLLAIGRIFFANFGLFYFVPQSYINGQLLPVTDVLDTFVFRAVYGSASMSLIKLGMAAAAGLYQSCVGLILVLVSNLLVRRISPQQSLF